MVDKITSTLKPSGLIAKINEIIDNLGGGSSIDVDQTYDGTSVNAQSGVAIEGAGFLQNKGTGTNSLGILGTATGNRGVGLGQASEGGGAYATGLGTGAKATGNYAIQIGYGTNSTASTLSIGFNASSSANRKNWELLDGTTGLIPYARIPYDNSTITVNSNNQLQAISRNIGEIVTSTIPLTDAELHLLDGALISGSGAYADFVTYIAGLVSTYPDLFETEANWQTAVTTYGVCGKFVYDSTNNTVRLPKITGIVEGTTDLTALGDLVQAGLPNITGSFTGHRIGTSDNAVADGAFTVTSSENRVRSGQDSATPKAIAVSFDASDSNSIYGNSTTVQPQSVKVLYYIVIATTTKTDIQVDIDEIATDLNGKVDKADLQECQVVIETYKNGTSWYRVYSDGWCEQGGINTTNSTSERTQSLLISYKDTNYSIQVSYNSDGNLSNGAIDAYEKAVGSFKLKSWSSDSLCWTAKGYIEV